MTKRCLKKIFGSVGNNRGPKLDLLHKDVSWGLMVLARLFQEISLGALRH